MTNAVGYQTGQVAPSTADWAGIEWAAVSATFLASSNRNSVSVSENHVWYRSISASIKE